jgi:hypothetical protein
MATFAEAGRDLLTLSQVAPQELEQQMLRIADQAVDILAERSPVDTGALRDSWHTEGPSVVNDRARAAYAADRWASRSAPAVFESLEDNAVREIERRLDIL